MATRKVSRGAHHRIKKVKARSPGPNTLTRKRLKEGISEVLLRFGGASALQEALDLRKPAVAAGELMAVYTGLERCYVDRVGIPQLYAVSGAENPNQVEVPRWLVAAVMKLLWQGIHGVWPSRGGRYATAAALYNSKDRKLRIAWQVLQARDDGSPWVSVFERVAEQLREKKIVATARTVEHAYREVAQAYRSNSLRSYLFRPVAPVPQDWYP